jgi:hypothetical protein
MTIDAMSATKPAGLLADEDVLGPMQRWQAAGQRVALVTLVDVEGGAPRQAGAQMAIAEDGRYAGYLSGGCLEEAIVLEAQAVIARGANRLVRYGKDSPYNTAGDENAPYCHDVRGNLLLRDPPAGSVYAWDCDHIIPRERGGTDAWWNLRAMQSSCNRSEGDRS